MTRIGAAPVPRARRAIDPRARRDLVDRVTFGRMLWALHTDCAMSWQQIAEDLPELAMTADAVRAAAIPPP